MRRMMYTDPITFKRMPFLIKNTPWYCNYIINSCPDEEKWIRLFCLQFRMQYDAFLNLVDQCKKSSIFHQQTKSKVQKYNKKTTTPIKVLVLFVLCYPGRSWTLDDLVEATAINYETIRLFLHTFLEFGSSTLYNKYVVRPSTLDQLKNLNQNMLMLVFLGALDLQM